MKKSANYYTKAKVDAARENCSKYVWAAKQRDMAVKKAEAYLNIGFKNLLKMVTPQSLPRSYAVNQEYGCPVCGTQVNKYGRWPYLADVINKPWKIICPNCKTVFPSNDFGAYYESGKDKFGVFDPDLADRSLLVNTLYPEKGPNWCVDDGFGWKGDNDEKYTFIAFYNHWKIWINMIDERGNSFPEGWPLGHGGILHGSLDAFKEAYLLTGDEKYAEAGLAVLDRIADFYPAMDSSVYTWDNGFLNSHGGSGKGKLVGCIWDTGIARSFAEAYDAFFPAAKKLNMEDTCINIENNILRQIYEGVLTKKIRGNNGSHQSALAMAAVVLDDPGETPLWLDNVLFGDGRIALSLIDDIDRDGFGNEAAPSYNHIWISTFLQIANIIETYGKYEKGNLYKNPKFMKMLEAFSHLVMIGRYTPQIGDSASCGNPGIIGTIEEAVNGFEKTGDPLFLKMVYYLNNSSCEGIYSSIFNHDPERIRYLIEDLPEKKLESSNLTGYGFTALRDGEEEFMRDLWVYWGSNTGHGHKDTLHLGIHAYGIDMAPDLGYPEKCDHTWKKTHHWDKNTSSHNTVIVDGQNQSDSNIGQSHHYEDHDLIKITDISAEKVYPQTEIYRRISSLVSINEKDSYIIDFFRVKGGSDHRYIFHGASDVAFCEGANLVKQDKGTYAGEEFEFGTPSKTIPGEPLYRYMGNGFHYLKNAEKTNDVPGVFAIDWPIKDNWHVLSDEKDLHLKLTMLTGVSDIALADGIPSQNRPGNPESLKYFIARRHDVDLSSSFISIIEPYEGSSEILSAQKINMQPKKGSNINKDDYLALKIVLKTGRSDYIICSLDPEIEFIIEEDIEFKGFYGMISIQNKEITDSFLCEGEKLTMKGKSLISLKPKIEGSVLDFTRDLSFKNEITVKITEDFETDDIVDHHIYVKNESKRNPVYKIKNVLQKSSDTYVLDIGNITLINRLNDPDSIDGGYVYDIKENDIFIIPLSR